MSSIVDAFNDAFNERGAILKIGLYAIPAFFCIRSFVLGQTNALYFWATVTGILFFALLTNAIGSVRLNQREVITLNPFAIMLALLKASVTVIPQALFWVWIAYLIVSKISIPVDIPHIDLIFQIIVWSIAGSIIMTIYLTYAKYGRMLDAFNYKAIFTSCVDVFVAILFFIPQLLLANAIIVGPFAYIFWFFHIPFSNWGFILCCALASVVNISIIANYLAQVSYENITLSDDSKEDYQITRILEDIDTEKGNL